MLFVVLILAYDAAASASDCPPSRRCPGHGPASARPVARAVSLLAAPAFLVCLLGARVTTTSVAATGVTSTFTVLLATARAVRVLGWYFLLGYPRRTLAGAGRWACCSVTVVTTPSIYSRVMLRVFITVSEGSGGAGVHVSLQLGVLHLVLCTQTRSQCTSSLQVPCVMLNAWSGNVVASTRTPPRRTIAASRARRLASLFLAASAFSAAFASASALRRLKRFPFM